MVAAHRGGITTVIIPKDNEKDLAEVPENVTKGLTIKPVKWIDEVLEIALESMPIPLTEEEYEDSSEETVERNVAESEDELRAH